MTRAAPGRVCLQALLLPSHLPRWSEGQSRARRPQRESVNRPALHLAGGLTAVLLQMRLQGTFPESHNYLMVVPASPSLNHTHTCFWNCSWGKTGKSQPESWPLGAPGSARWLPLPGLLLNFFFFCWHLLVILPFFLCVLSISNKCSQTYDSFILFYYGL